MTDDKQDGRTWSDRAQTAFYVMCALALCGTLLLRVVAWLTRAAQDRLVYFPCEPENSHVVCESPSTYGIAHAEDVHIRTSDGVSLRGYLMWPPPSSSHVAATSPSLSSSSVAGVVYDGVVARTTACSAATDDSIAYDGKGNNSCSCSSSSAVTTTAAAAAAGCGTASGSSSEVSSLHASMGSHGGNSGGSGNARHVTAATTAAPSSSSSFALLYFHGNAGNVGHRIEVARLLVTQLRCTLLMVDYRGYGLSARVEPSQEGLERDAQACLDFLCSHSRVPRDRVFVMGTSLGGAVAIHLAAQPANARCIRGVIVENTFTSLADMTATIAKVVIRRYCAYAPRLAYLFFRCYVMPVALMLRWNSVRAVRRVPMPMLFLSGLEDEIVPAEQMQRLYNAALHRKRLRTFVTFAHGQHNNLIVEPTYMEALRGFVREVVNRPVTHEHVSE